MKNLIRHIIGIILIVLFILIFNSQVRGYEVVDKVDGRNRGYKAFELSETMQEKLGYDRYDTVIIINNCKKYSRNVPRCIKVAGMIGYAESGGWNNCYKNNCMGLYDGSKGYTSKHQMFKDRMNRYVKYWYPHPEYRKYYRKDGIPPLTHYCMGPKGDGICRAGYNNARKAFYILNK